MVLAEEVPSEQPGERNGVCRRCLRYEKVVFVELKFDRKVFFPLFHLILEFRNQPGVGMRPCGCCYGVSADVAPGLCPQGNSLTVREQGISNPTHNDSIGDLGQEVILEVRLDR